MSRSRETPSDAETGCGHDDVNVNDPGGTSLRPSDRGETTDPTLSRGKVVEVESLVGYLREVEKTPIVYGTNRT